MATPPPSAKPPTRPASLDLTVRKVLVGFLLRCPNCEQGRIFTGLFAMNQTCPQCQVRFERQSGESVGGMYINLVVAELLSLGGFFAFHLLLRPPIVPHVIFWVAFNLAFVLVFYRHSRAMWIAVSYLANGLLTDAEAGSRQSGSRP